MQQNSKVILGDISRVMLWSFELELKDRRTGDCLEGYTVEIGNEDYELTIAEAAIRQRYGRLGYEVTDCNFIEERIAHFDNIKEYEKADESDSGRQPEYNEQEDEDDAPDWQEERAAALAELDG